MINNISVFILAGGNSSRMNKNKALLLLNEELVIEKLLSTLRNVFSKVYIICNQPEIFSQYDVEVFKDIYPKMGPVAGIHSALKNSDNNVNFITACDMPLLTEGLITYLLQFIDDSEIIIPYDNSGNYPLISFYSKKLVNKAEQLLLSAKKSKLNDGVKLKDFIRSSRSKSVDIRKYSGYNPDRFINMNETGDYNKILSILRKKNT